MIQDFFKTLYGTDNPGYFEIATDDFRTNKWFQWPQQADFAEKYVGLRTEENVWISTTLYAERERQKEYATYGNAVYADADTCHPSNFRLRPTLAVETSEGRWHCYWQLDRNYSAVDISDASRRISLAHRKQGCDQSGWMLTKMLRVPGTSRIKPEDPVPFRVRVREDTGNVYTLSQILDAYDNVEPVQVEQFDKELPTNLPKVSESAAKIPDDVYNLYADEVPDNGTWSERMWKLEIECFRGGMTREEVFVVMSRAKCNKYNPEHADARAKAGLPTPERSDPDATLWTEVLKAEQAYLMGERPEAIEVDKPDRTPVALGRPQFITDEERVLVAENPTFIDDYVAWVATRTDSAEVYQRTLAFQMLSCIYGEVGYVRPSHGRMDLNLWVLILGGTTFSRKSTARNLFLRMLHALERATNQTIDIGSDFTPEGLNKELANRNGLVSLIHRDEVHGFLREMYTKNYMSGGIERMTALYDGKVDVSIRATKGASQSTRSHTIFNMLGLGIEDEIAEVMTEKHFRSGFLARFLWAVGEPPEVTPDMVRSTQLEVEHDSLSRDEYVEEVIEYVQETLNAYNARDGAKHAVLFSEMAFERFNEWEEQVSGIGPNGVKAPLEMMGPSIDRMKNSVWKSAALLALHRGSTTIEMQDLLPALEQAELWYRDLGVMASKISSSEFSRLTDQVERFIATGPNQARKKSAVYAHFKQHRAHELQEFLESLRLRGVIVVEGQEVRVRDEDD